MTSLLLGLMMNSAKNTLETNNRNIRSLAIELILLDRTMRALGPETEDARRHLVKYVKTELNEWQGNPFEANPRQEASLEAAGTSLRAIRVPDEQKATWEGARDRYKQVIRQRWILVDASGGTIPDPLIIFCGSAQRHHDGFVLPGGVAHLGGPLPNRRYGYAIYRHIRADPSVERSLSTGVGRIAALKAWR
jgi:hypothetical protein